MTSKTVILACVAGAVLGLADNGDTLAAQPGFYAFAGLGSADLERALNGFERFDGDDLSYELGLGFSINRYFAVQAGYQDFGEVGAIAGCPPELVCIAGPGSELVAFSPDRVALDGVSLQLVGTLPIDAWPIDLIGRIGALAWDSKWKQNRHLDESDTDLMYAIGINWAPVDRWGFQLQYQKVDLDVKSFTLGATFRF